MDHDDVLNLFCFAKDVQPLYPEPGLRRFILATGSQMMLVRHLMDEGYQGAAHSHPHDQMVYVLAGRLRVVVAESTFEVGPQDSFIVPGGVQHQATALEAADVLDAFTPQRRDYL
ncbi:MAG: cupin domain-containing protein [Deltaproteobacteria bacterium]|nr:cupin domain-containing protein [Deltaproteobacteria bacterium]